VREDSFVFQAFNMALASSFDKAKSPDLKIISPSLFKRKISSTPSSLLSESTSKLNLCSSIILHLS